MLNMWIQKISSKIGISLCLTIGLWVGFLATSPLHQVPLASAVPGDITPPVFNFTTSLSGTYTWPEAFYIFGVTDEASILTEVTINFQYAGNNETYTVNPDDGGLDSLSETFSSFAGFTSADNSDVPYTITFTATDEEGNEAQQVFEVLYAPDTLAPVIALTAQPSAADDGSATFEGTSTDAETFIKTVQFELDGGERFNATIVDDGLEDELSEAFTVNFTDLAEGDHTLVLFTTDIHDNLSQSSVTWNVDTSAPTCTSGFVNVPSPHKSNVVTYTGITCTDNRGIVSARYGLWHNVEGDINNGDTALQPVDGSFGGTTESFTFTYTLDELLNLDGTVNMTLIVEDAVGNESYDYDPLVIEYTDNTAPVLTVTPISPNPITDPTLVLTGSCGDTDSLDTNSLISVLRYRIDSGSWQNIASVDTALDEYREDFSVAVPDLDEGTYDFEVSCSDATNHTSTYTQEVTIAAQDPSAIPEVHTFSDSFTGHQYHDIANSSLIWGNGKLRLKEDITVSRQAVDTTGFLSRYETNYTSFMIAQDVAQANILWYVKKDKIFQYNTTTGISSELLRSDYGFGGSFVTIKNVVSTVWNDNGTNKRLLWVGDAYNLYIFNLTDQTAVAISTFGEVSGIFPDLNRGRLGAYLSKPGDGEPGYTNLLYYDFHDTLTDTGDDQYAFAPTDVAGFTDDGFVSLLLNSDTDMIYASFLGEGIYKFDDQDTPLVFSDDEIALHVSATDIFGGFLLDPDGHLIYGTANNQHPYLYVVTNENGTPMDRSDDTVKTLAEPIDLQYLNVAGLQYIEGQNGVGDQLMVTTETGSPVYCNFNDTYDDPYDDTFILLDVAGGIRPGAASSLVTDYDTMYATVRNQGFYKVTLNRGWQNNGDAITIPARPSQKLVLNHFVADATADTNLVAFETPAIGGWNWLSNLLPFNWSFARTPQAFAAEPTTTYYMSNDDGITWDEITLNQLTTLSPNDYRVKFKISMAEADGATPVLSDYSLNFGGYPSEAVSQSVASYTVLGSPASIAAGNSVTFTTTALDSLGYKVVDHTGTLTATLLTASGDTVSGVSLANISLSSGLGTLTTTQLTNTGTFKIRVSDGTRTADSNVITVTGGSSNSDTASPTPSTATPTPSTESTPTPSPTPALTTTNTQKIPQLYLYADKYLVEKGEKVTFTWTSEYLHSLTLTPGKGAVDDTGSFTTEITDTTTFTLSGTGSSGELTSTVVIKLKDAQKEKLSLKVSDSQRIARGEKATVSWETTGAESVYVDYLGREAALSGSFEFYPTQKTIITITAKKGNQEIKKQVTITVGASPFSWLSKYFSGFPGSWVVSIPLHLLLAVLIAVYLYRRLKKNKKTKLSKNLLTNH